jgi:hypothetical protein
VKNWHKVPVELHSILIGLSGAQGLFSTLQERIRHPETKSCLRLIISVHDFLDDFQCLTVTRSERPSRIAKLLPHMPSTTGTCDAAKDGMVSIHFIPNPDGTMHPFLWQQHFPVDIINRLVTGTIPTSDLTISNFELAATVTHHDIGVQAVDI